MNLLKECINCHIKYIGAFISDIAWLVYCFFIGEMNCLFLHQLFGASEQLTVSTKSIIPIKYQYNEKYASKK